VVRVSYLTSRRGKRRILRTILAAITEQLAFLHHLRDLRRHHALPRGIVLLDAFQYITRENVQDALINVIQPLDAPSFHQVPEKILLGAGNFKIVHRCPVTSSRSGYT
jgi:hypothetical protein